MSCEGFPSEEQGQQLQTKPSLFGRWSSFSGSDHSPDSSDNSIPLEMEHRTPQPNPNTQFSKRLREEEHESAHGKSEDLELKKSKIEKKGKDKHVASVEKSGNKKITWNSNDEFVFLREFGECRGKMLPKSAIFNNVKSHLEGKYSDSQLDNKMKKLRRKFRDLMKKKTEPGFSFKNASDEELYKLARKAWGTDTNKNENENEKEADKPSDEEEEKEEDKENDDRKTPGSNEEDKDLGKEEDEKNNNAAKGKKGKEKKPAKNSAGNIMCTPTNQPDWELMEKYMEKSRNDMLARVGDMLIGVGETIKSCLREKVPSSSSGDLPPLSEPEEKVLILKRLEQEALEVDVMMKRLALKKKCLERGYQSFEGLGIGTLWPICDNEIV